MQWNKNSIEKLSIDECSQLAETTVLDTILLRKTTRTDGQEFLRYLISRASLRVIFVECNGTKIVSRSLVLINVLPLLVTPSQTIYFPILEYSYNTNRVGLSQKYQRNNQSVASKTECLLVGPQ